MTVALVSCGLSAAAFADSDHEGPVVAVSRMAALVRCDWWACFDLPIVRTLVTLGSPGLFTLRATYDSLHRQGCTCDTTIAETLSCPVDRWTLYTAPAGLVLAAEVLKASRIDCYGVDMTGTLDVTGGTGEDRSESRWARERAIWDAVVMWLSTRGVEVKRI